MDENPPLETFDQIPGRVFLDTTVVNLVLDFGDQIFEAERIPDALSPRLRADVEAICGVFDTGRWACWQFAVSPGTYAEVVATADPARRARLETWFAELWHYWCNFEFPYVPDTEELREHLRLIAATLPQEADRDLVSDAVIYGCDAFCTRDWRTILRHRGELSRLPLRLMSPAEWWAMIRPWAAIWL